MKKNSSKAYRTKILSGCIVVILAFVFTFLWFSNRLLSIMSDTNNSFLEETSSHQAALFNTKLNDQLAVLESLAKQFADINFSNYTELKNAVLSLNDIGDFQQLTVADSSGACMSNNNTYSANISKKQYFQSAIHGEPTVSNGIDVNAQGEDILALSVPIYQKNKIVGVLTGTYERSVLDSLFSTTMFNGNGYTYIIDSDGNIMVKTENVNSLVSGSNYFELLEDVELLNNTSLEAVRDDFARGNANTINYKVGSQERYAAYYPVGLHDWYVISVITDEVIATQTQDLSFMTTIFATILAAMLLGIFIFILALLQKTELLTMRNERFTLVNPQNQSIIFAYDITKKLLDLSGDVPFIFGDYPATAPIDIPHIASRIHPDDVSSFEHYVATCKTSDMYNAFEARFRCDDDNYRWFRLSSTLIKDKNQPTKLVGNMINVESQLNQELGISTDTDKDAVTGLLNQKAFAYHMDAFLKTQNESSIHALFLIDLDNFKSINNHLGHVFGDKVLTDTAARLSRIFSEKDLLARIGNNQFAAFLNLADFDSEENAQRIITQKGHSIKHLLHENYKGQSNLEITLTASIGIAVCGKDGTNYSTLYNNADKALYITKRNGKNGYTFYSKES